MVHESVPNSPLILEPDSLRIGVIRSFNGHRYGRLERQIRVVDPLHRKDGALGERVFKIPLGWFRLRDHRGRFRFWFASESC